MVNPGNATVCYIRHEAIELKGSLFSIYIYIYVNNIRMYYLMV